MHATVAAQILLSCSEEIHAGDEDNNRIARLHVDRLDAIQTEQYRRAGSRAKRIRDLALPLSEDSPSEVVLDVKECPPKGLTLDQWAGAAYNYPSTNGVWSVPMAPVLKPGVARSLKMLVSVANYGPKSEQSLHVVKLLENLADICKYGVDISILLHVTTGQWGFLEKGAPVCERTGRPLNVDVIIHKDEANHHARSARGRRDDMFTGRHRKSWEKRWTRGDRYDWWMYIEHDIGITIENFVMLLHEFEHLNGTRYMPGLLRYENAGSAKHLVEMDTGSGKVCERSAKTGRNPYVNRTVLIRGREYIVPDNGYQAMYMLPAHMIEPLLKQKSWTEPCRPNDIRREIFASYWLFRGAIGSPDNNQHIPFIKVVPLETINAFLVNHIGDKYVTFDKQKYRTPRLSSEQLIRHAAYCPSEEIVPVDAVWKSLGFKVPKKKSPGQMKSAAPDLTRMRRCSHKLCFDVGEEVN